AGLNPTAPFSDTVCQPGSTLRVMWQEDGKSPSIASFPKLIVYFMSGSDQQQKYLAKVCELSPSNNQSYCDHVIPQVEPVGKWYFYRFTDGANTTNEYYTTRFTITDSNGQYPQATSPAPPSGKNPGQDGKIVSNSTNSSPTSLIGSSTSSSSIPTSSSSDTPASYVPAAQATKTAQSNTKPSSAQTAKQSGISKEAADSKPSNVGSGASFLENTKELMFSVIVGLTLNFLVLPI
ncbi:14906_t:CDS:2, partial [Cetraspora pellucida]